jgi:hypothetical protein
MRRPALARAFTENFFAGRCGQSTIQKFYCATGTQWHFAFCHIRVLREAGTARK